ncbi:hypothetical protein B0O99DRAFT_695482 [Bisporella sp. PMI_857]|nr:hypothetical protein B0O99DRAFT_695482 [Bisporella sp. PMI_857]
MHTPPHFMPGAFNSCVSTGPEPRFTTAKSNIFQPPRTPSVSASSSLVLTRSATSAMSTEYTNISNAGRKRSRLDYNDGRQTPEPRRGDDPGSPLPFVNTRYAIKGGMDTPTLQAAQIHDSVSEFGDVRYRRDAGLLGEDTGGYQSFLPLPLELDRESNGRPRRSTSSQFGPAEGWSRTAFEVVGEVVGKVWEFCKKGAFRGFTAGGGKGYAVKNEECHFKLDESEAWTDDRTTTTLGIERESTPLPGQFPEEEFIPDYWDHATPEATPPRAGKRRQIGENNDELTRNWVVVPPAAENQITTPSKPQVRAAAGPARYSMPTASSASRRARPASRAGPALSNAPQRRAVLNRISHAGSPVLQSSHPASFASPRSPQGSRIPRATASPGRNGSSRVSVIGEPRVESPAAKAAAKEAQKWAAAKKREDMEAEITMRRMDKQLKDMIRQGKEALGSKVEIEMEEDYTPSKPSHAGSGSKKWAI